MPLALPAPPGSPLSVPRRSAALLGYLLLAVALYAATGLETPELGAGLVSSLLSLPRVGGLAALVARDAVFPPRRHRVAHPAGAA